MESCQGNEVILGWMLAGKMEGLLADTSNIPQEPVKWISVCQEEPSPYLPFLWHLAPC